MIKPGSMRKKTRKDDGTPMQGRPRLTAAVLAGDLTVEISRGGDPVQHVRCVDKPSALGLAAVVNGILP